VLVSEGFLKKLKPVLKEKAKEKAISKAERFAARPTLVSLFKDTEGDKEKRDTKIHAAFKQYRFTLSHVEAVVGLRYLTISHIVKRA